MNDEPIKDADPSPESILRAMEEGDQFWGSSCPSLEALHSVIERLYAATVVDKTNPLGDSDGEICFGRFHIEKELGRGGFGRVFLAIDRTLNRQVALKVPRPKLCTSDKLRRSWLAEAEVVALLDHPNIVPVFEAGEIDKLIYIVSAYCPGKTLDAWFDDQGRTIEPRQAAHLLICLADAVAHAHDRGILHRDIKPSNILCLVDTSTSGDHAHIVPKLTDFGLAKSLLVCAEPAEDFGPIGTPRYMAPEQASANVAEVGVTADVYSLGVVLFELLTGEPPFVDGDVRETLQRIQHEEISPSRLLQRRVPRDLAAICVKCLAKRPAGRYASAAALRDDLQRFLNSRPVLARPVGRLVTLGRWCQRRPAVAGLLGTVLVVITLGTSTAAWYAREARRHAQQSQNHELYAREQAGLAGKHLADAQRALLDLGWVAQETTVWIDVPDNFRTAVSDQVNRHYQQIIESGIASPDASLRAAALSVQGTQASRQGDLTRAEQAFEASLGLWREAILQFPDVQHYRRSMALTLFGYGMHLQRTGRADESEARFSDGRKTFQEIISREASDPKIRAEYATVLFELATNYAQSGQSTAAKSMFELSLAEFEWLVAHVLENGEYHMRTGQVERMLGEMAMRHRNRERALRFLESSLENLECALRKSPNNSVYRLQLAEACRALGRFHREQQPAQSQVYLERAVDLLQALNAESSVAPGTPYSLALTLGELAPTYQRRGDFQRAVEAYGQCADVWAVVDSNQPLAPTYLSAFAFACFDHAELAIRRRVTETASLKYDQAHNLFQRLDKQRKLSSAGRLAWAQCYLFRGNEQQSLGNTSDAADHFHQALTLLDRVSARQPDNPIIEKRRQAVRSRLDQLASPSDASATNP